MNCVLNASTRVQNFCLAIALSWAATSTLIYFPGEILREKKINKNLQQMTIDNYFNIFKFY